MVVRYKFNLNKTNEVTIFDREKQKTVGGMFKAKDNWFVYKFSGKKIILTKKSGYVSKVEALTELKRLF